MTLGSGANDSPVGNDNAGNLEVSLESFLDNNSSLLESTVGAVRNANQEVLLVRTISLTVINHLGGVQEDDLEVLLEVLMLGAKRAEALGDVLFKFGGFFVVLLEDFISIMEHVCDIFVQ